MLRLLMLMLLILCAQFVVENNAEHKVLFKLSTYPSIFRLDDNFNRSYASIPNHKRRFPYFKGAMWEVSKYIKTDTNTNEVLNIKTKVSSGFHDDVIIGNRNPIRLNIVNYKKNNLLVLQNKQSNELIELKPYKKRKVVTQLASIKSSSVAKHSSKRSVGRKNGVELDQIDFVFIQARIPKLSKKPIYNNAINGRVSLNSGEIDSGELVFTDLLKIGNDSIEPLEFNYITINNGGQFAFEYMGQMVSGIFSKASNDTYVMRVATGILSGASFTFAKEGSDAAVKTAKLLRSAKDEQDRLVKERSLASKRALERSSYQF